MLSPGKSYIFKYAVFIFFLILQRAQTILMYLCIVSYFHCRLCFRNELNSGQRVRLIYSGRLLQDDTARISFYGIENYSVLHAQISDVRRTDENEQSTTYHQEADLDLSKLFLPILAIILTLCWYGFFYYRHLFSAASVIILVFMTFAFGVLAHVITS